MNQSDAAALPPHALGNWPQVRELLAAHRAPALFLDYDGTLTPIVPRPELATLAQATRELLQSLAACLPLAIISGRDARDVRRLVGIDSLHYAGSHGFEIVGPDGLCLSYPPAESYLPALETMQSRLGPLVEEVPGALLERKRYSLAVHYRQADGDEAAALCMRVRRCVDETPRLKLTSGKMVLEVQPRLDWDKGRALAWLAEVLNLGGCMPLFIGDDLTDENAFREVRQSGLGIVVLREPRDTLARFRLSDTREVTEFLSRLLAWWRGGDAAAGD